MFSSPLTDSKIAVCYILHTLFLSLFFHMLSPSLSLFVHLKCILIGYMCIFTHSLPQLPQIRYNTSLCNSESTTRWQKVISKINSTVFRILIVYVYAVSLISVYNQYAFLYWLPKKGRKWHKNQHIRGNDNYAMVAIQ